MQTVFHTSIQSTGHPVHRYELLLTYDERSSPTCIFLQLSRRSKTALSRAIGDQRRRVNDILKGLLVRTKCSRVIPLRADVSAPNGNAGTFFCPLGEFGVMVSRSFCSPSTFDQRCRPWKSFKKKKNPSRRQDQGDLVCAQRGILRGKFSASLLYIASVCHTFCHLVLPSCSLDCHVYPISFLDLLCSALRSVSEEVAAASEQAIGLGTGLCSKRWLY